MLQAACDYYTLAANAFYLVNSELSPKGEAAFTRHRKHTHIMFKKKEVCIDVFLNINV